MTAPAAMAIESFNGFSCWSSGRHEASGAHEAAAQAAGFTGPSCRNFTARRKAGLYCPMPGKVPMPLHRIVSITSSAPPAMEARRPSRKARLTGVSFM